MSAFWRHARAVAGKEIIAEIRTGEVLLLTAPFGAVVLLQIPLAIGTDAIGNQRGIHTRLMRAWARDSRRRTTDSELWLVGHVRRRRQRPAS